MPRWSNWARTVSVDATSVARPQDEAGLAALVARAAEEGRRVRIPGSGHSWSACAAPEDQWVDLSALPRTIEVQDEQVRVAGHVPLKDLCAALEAQGRMLPNLGTITEQTVAGATSTGTHGTGRSLPVISAGIRGMRLVDGTGRIRSLGPEDPALRDARVGLGALGLLTELTLGTVPAGRLHERLENHSLDSALEHLDHWVDTHRHLRLWWLPHAGVVQVYRADPTDAADTGPNALAVRLDRWGLQQPVFAALLTLAGWAPALVPAIHRFAQASSFPPRSRVEDQRKVLTMPVPPRHDEVEVAIDRAQVHDALRAWWDLAHRQPQAPDFVQEVRFVAGDDIALSPAHGRTSAYLGAYCTNPGTAGTYFGEFLALARDLGARPHWGKRFDHDHHELAALYPRWADFQALRADLDPQGVFRSSWHDRVLGPLGPG